jgi:hypothetical protein
MYEAFRQLSSQRIIATSTCAKSCTQTCASWRCPGWSSYFQTRHREHLTNIRFCCPFLSFLVLALPFLSHPFLSCPFPSRSFPFFIFLSRFFPLLSFSCLVLSFSFLSGVWGLRSGVWGLGPGVCGSGVWGQGSRSGVWGLGSAAVPAKHCQSDTRPLQPNGWTLDEFTQADVHSGRIHSSRCARGRKHQTRSSSIARAL